MKQRNLRLEVLIFEPRDFNRPGPSGCNRCAGILSSHLIMGLESLDITLPEEVIQSDIHAYAVHMDGEELRIEQPDPNRRIVSIYRGAGPRMVLTDPPPISFDGFLLEQACARGATHIPSRARLVRWADRPIVHTAQERYRADLLILATGVNSRAPLGPEYGYRAPRTAVMAQDEFLRPVAWPDEQVNAYFKNPPGLVFGAMIPKGSYLNISLLGRRLTTDTVNDFLDAQGLNLELSAADSLCGCTPRIVVRAARNYFGERWVSIGDAAVTRLYKDGIGSAFNTAKWAVEAAVQGGVSQGSFRRFYAPFCRGISVDNTYGKMLFSLWSLSVRLPPVLEAWARAIRRETELPVEERYHARVLWGMFTGDENYRDLFWQLLSPKSLVTMWPGLK